jgi:hypothetical protein
MLMQYFNSALRQQAAEHDALEQQMISELEVLYKRLDEARMTEADRHAAKAHLAQAEALVELVASAARFIRGRSVAAPRSSGRPAQASS